MSSEVGGKSRARGRRVPAPTLRRGARRALLGGLLILLAACGGEPTSPLAPTSPAPTPPLVPVQVRGRVVSNPGGEPVPSATLTATEWPAPMTTDAEGRFSFEAGHPVRVTVEAEGFLTRETGVAVYPATTPTVRDDVVIGLIANRPPFSLEFYREYVRNGWERPDELRPIRRWMWSPNFHLQSVTADTGKSLPSELLDRIEHVFRARVPELTGGQFRAGRFTRSAEPERAWGWVLVQVYFGRLPGAGDQVYGRGAIGGDLIEVRLVTAFGGDDCGFVTVEFTAHELVHVLGFYHTGHDEFGPFGVTPCGSIGPVAQLHAAIAYSRPPGNVDPDRDPELFHLLTPSFGVVGPGGLDRRRAEETEAWRCLLVGGKTP